MNTCARDSECLGYPGNGLPNEVETPGLSLCSPCQKEAEKLRQITEEAERTRELNTAQRGQREGFHHTY
jgi:hypothetical protein